MTAVLSMGFTISSSNDIFKATYRTIANCYSFDQGTFTGPGICTFAKPITCASAIIGRPVKSLVDESANTLCGTGTVNFCCATLIESPVQQCNEPVANFTDCNGATQTNKYPKICTIYCKP